MRQLRLPLQVRTSSQQPMPSRNNRYLAKQLREIADLLATRGVNPYRVRAYRRAAETLDALGEPVSEIYDRQGRPGLARLKAIGRSLAMTIEQLICTGHVRILDRLRRDNTPEHVFATVPDIGPELARRIHEQLGIETLAELQAAVTDGSLSKVPGMGPKRLRAVRESLAVRLHPQDRSVDTPPPPSSSFLAKVSSRKPWQRPLDLARGDEPSVAQLLEIDSLYRTLAQLGRLPKVAPRSFNPTGDAWLPVMRERRGEQLYTVMYSNTARAHQLGTIRDWVVIYCTSGSVRGRWTVITSTFGSLAGRRMVRGREELCEQYYQQHEAAQGRGQSDKITQDARKNELNTRKSSL